MNEVSLNDIALFALGAIIIVSLSFFAGGVNNYVGGQLAQVSSVQKLTDFDLFKACFGQPVTGNCTKADFNSDGVIGIPDFNLFRNVTQYDLNNDNKVEWTYNKVNNGGDFNILLSCLTYSQGGTPISPRCTKADLNNDGRVDAHDYLKLASAQAYDLDGDGKVTYTKKGSDGGAVKSDLEILKSCFFQPVTGTCVKADFNDDGTIDFLDLGVFKSAVVRYDLDGDGVAIAQSDYSLFLACFSVGTASSTGCAQSDFNNDGFVNIDDFNLYLSAKEYDLNGNGTIESMGAGETIEETEDRINTCGDVNADGVVDITDSNLIMGSLLVPPTATLARPDLCDVGGSIGCSTADAVIITRANLNPPTATITQQCKVNTPDQCGDVNGDGFVNFTDSSIISSAIAAGDVSGKMARPDLCDVGGAVGCTIEDAQIVANFAGGSGEIAQQCKNPTPDKCGDVTGDGSVDGADLTIYKRTFSDLPPGMARPDLCDVGGSLGCTNEDLNIIKKYFGGVGQLTQQCKKAFPDKDKDGVPDSTDNCVSIPNTSQADRGGVGTGSKPDGIGDACQCGDVDGDGIVSGLDATIAFRDLRGLQPKMNKPELCDVGGVIGCTSGDATIILNASLNVSGAVVTQQCINTPPDQDNDRIPDSTDNCISIPNANQADRGGIGLNSFPDGIGDACQCGDVNADGVVSGLDGSLILQSQLVPPTVTLTNPNLCDVGGSIGCTSADSVIIKRASLGTATIKQQCVGGALMPVPTPTPDDDPVVCTADAKQCPDGSYVGRVAPSCNFAPCSTTTPTTPITPTRSTGGK